MLALFGAARNIPKYTYYIEEIEMDLREKLAISAKTYEPFSSSHPV